MATREKAPGGCGMPAKVWKYSGTKLKERIYNLIVDIWEHENMPQDWKDVDVVPIFKKGSRMSVAITQEFHFCQLLDRLWIA